MTGRKMILYQTRNEPSARQPDGQGLPAVRLCLGLARREGTCRSSRSGPPGSGLGLWPWEPSTSHGSPTRPTSFAILDAAFERGVNLDRHLRQLQRRPDRGADRPLVRRRAAAGARRRCWPARSIPRRWSGGRADPVKRAGTLGRSEPTGLSAKHIREACEASLKRLNTDYLDLYQMHHVDRARAGRRSGRRWRCWSRRARCSTSASRTSPAGTSPRRRRRARSARLPWPRLRAERLQPDEAHGGAGGASRRRAPMAWRSCPTARWPPACWAASRRTTTAAGAPSCAGRRRSTRSRRSARSSARRPAPSRWPGWRASPGVTAPVIGPRTHGTAQRQSGRGRARPRRGDAWTRLDELFPGPGGPAPEAYAW